MASSHKKIIIPLFIGLIVLAGVVYLLKNTSSSEKTVKILNYGFSICTQDVPPSGCGPYEVEVQSINGKKSTYQVSGFGNHESKHYNEITSKITRAKEQNTTVILEVNDKGAIVSIR